jgi:CDGSH-type Zn-finger protein
MENIMLLNIHKYPRKHVQDLPAGQKVEICRCWLSAEFPICDGAHKKHNAETGDNVGPAVLTGVPAVSEGDA